MGEPQCICPVRERPLWGSREPRKHSSAVSVASLRTLKPERARPQWRSRVFALSNSVSISFRVQPLAHAVVPVWQFSWV